MIPTEPQGQRAPAAINRRTLIKGGLLGAGLAAAPLGAQALGGGFTHGVASGEPAQTSVLLWTRCIGEAEIALEWQVAEDQDFARVVAEGFTRASPERDWCAKAVADGLTPDKWYYYRFVAPDGSKSDVGRTRTLPDGPVARWRMAVFSCSNIGFGWFNAYAHAAEDGAFDMVVHTGDYLYEYQQGNYPTKLAEGRELLPVNEIVTLADYRLRHANYRADPDLRRLTQLYPMVMGWDDHESTNDSWSGGAENHQPETEGDWSVRKGAAMRAYREWLPVSDEPWARYDIGDLASLFRLETRLTARSQPPALADLLKGATNREDMLARLKGYRSGAYTDPARTMMGEAQERWLAEGLKESRRSGRTWQVLAQQVIMGALASPADLVEGLVGTAPDWLKGRLQLAATASRAGLPANMDAWDGYPAARERLLAAAREADANLVVLTGDSHNAWAFQLDHSGEAAGIEFAGHSVTSPGFEAYLGTIAPVDLAKAMVERNPQLAWAETSRRGYMAVELSPGSATCEWRFMAGVRERSTRLASTHRMVSLAGSNRFGNG